MPANENSDTMCCATVDAFALARTSLDALAPADFAAAQPQAGGRPATLRVVDNLPGIIAVTAKEIAAVEMFLGAALDQLLSE